MLLTAPVPCECPDRGQLLSEELKGSRLERQEHFPTLGLGTEAPRDSKGCKQGLGSQQPQLSRAGLWWVPRCDERNDGDGFAEDVGRTMPLLELGAGKELSRPNPFWNDQS